MTTSLELSKKLLKAGLKIETEKWWVKKIYEEGYKDREVWLILTKEEKEKTEAFPDPYKYEFYPAPSTDELLAVMPQYIYDRQNMLTIVKDDNETYWVGYSDHEGVAYKKAFTDKSLPEVLGQVCVYLLTNGYHYKTETKMIEERLDE